MSEVRTERIFDEFPTVDCNECEEWWLNKCDGVQKAQKRSCTAFKATRSVVIPLEIKWLRTRLKWLTVAFVILAVLSVFQVVAWLLYFVL